MFSGVMPPAPQTKQFSTQEGNYNATRRWWQPSLACSQLPRTLIRELSTASGISRMSTTLFTSVTVLPLLALSEVQQEALYLKTLRDYYFVTENKQKS
jgi:hypothetical protein